MAMPVMEGVSPKDESAPNRREQRHSMEGKDIRIWLCTCTEYSVGWSPLHSRLSAATPSSVSWVVIGDGSSAGSKLTQRERSVTIAVEG